MRVPVLYVLFSASSSGSQCFSEVSSVDLCSREARVAYSGSASFAGSGGKRRFATGLHPELLLHRKCSAGHFLFTQVAASLAIVSKP